VCATAAISNDGNNAHQQGDVPHIHAYMLTRTLTPARIHTCTSMHAHARACTHVQTTQSHAVHHSASATMRHPLVITLPHALPPSPMHAQTAAALPVAHSAVDQIATRHSRALVTRFDGITLAVRLSVCESVSLLVGHGPERRRRPGR
jgi:hypothetical protein